MNNIYSFIVWFFFRPWHIWVPLLSTAAILIAGNHFNNYTRSIYATSGLVMQIMGVFILIMLLNQNMFSLKGITLLSEIKRWRSENPLTSKSGEILLSGIEAQATIADIKLRVKKQGRTPEEKIKILEDEIEAVRQEANDTKNALEKRIDNNKNEIIAKIDAMSGNVDNIKANLNNAVIGDYRWQIFSILIIVCGLIVSVLPIKVS